MTNHILPSRNGSCQLRGSYVVYIQLVQRKPRPTFYKNRERKKGLNANSSESVCTRNEGTEPRVPARDSGMHEAFLTLVRSAQKAIGRKGVLGPHTRNLPNLIRVVLRSRNSSETMVEASIECSTTLRYQHFSRRESFAPREASRGLC